MLSWLNSEWQMGSLQLSHRLIQGPLAGYSCAPMRRLFSHFQSPAYCVSEMVSAQDVLTKHAVNSRYLSRATEEKILCYQISGTDPHIMAEAAAKLEAHGANLIDINCGCPKSKIRKKGAGSALLETPERLISIVKTIKAKIDLPLSVKIRLHDRKQEVINAQQLADAGADAIIVHGRQWQEDYDIACDWLRIAAIKQAVSIPVIANGDIANTKDLTQAFEQSGCDAFMIARAGTGKPWLYQHLLNQEKQSVSLQQHLQLFFEHILGLANLDGEFAALLQSRSLLRYYFHDRLSAAFLRDYYLVANLDEALEMIREALLNTPSTVHSQNFSGNKWVE